MECYIPTLASIIHRQAPLLTKKFTASSLMTWFNNDIKKARRERRQAEIRRRRTRNASDLKGNLKKGRITQRIWWPRQVVSFSRTLLIGTVLIRRIYSWLQKRLLKQDQEVPFPLFKDKLTFANQMGSFVVEKNKTIHLKLGGLSSTDYPKKNKPNLLVRGK